METAIALCLMPLVGEGAHLIFIDTSDIEPPKMAVFAVDTGQRLCQTGTLAKQLPSSRDDITLIRSQHRLVGEVSWRLMGGYRQNLSRITLSTAENSRYICRRGLRSAWSQSAEGLAGKRESGMNRCVPLLLVGLRYCELVPISERNPSDACCFDQLFRSPRAVLP
jgi:hypothetical protein